MPWKAESRPETRAPPPESTTRLIRLSAAVAAKKSSERLISPRTVSVTPCMACSTSWGTTSWSSVAPPPIDTTSPSCSFTRTANRTIRLIQLDETQARDEIGRVHGSAGTIESFLARHLTDEEGLAVPIILHHRLRG